MSETNRRKAVIHLTEWNAAQRAIRRLQNELKELYAIVYENSPEADIPDLED